MKSPARIMYAEIDWNQILHYIKNCKKKYYLELLSVFCPLLKNLKAPDT